MNTVTDNGLQLLGILIRYNRKERGLSLRQLAKLANMSHTLISTIETGKVVPNKQTLKDLFDVLEIHFYDDPKLYKEFHTLSNRLMSLLLRYEFDEAKSVYKQLHAREEEYENSPLLVDYNLIKYLYLMMPYEKTINYDSKLSTLDDIYDYLTHEQKQLYLFIKGINYSNTRRFNDATDYLSKANKLGNYSLDPFVDVFLTHVYVHRYMFMDAIELGRQTILTLEKSMNYKWAMHTRLTLGKSYYLVRRFDKSKELFNQVLMFSKQYNVDRLLERTYLLTAEMYHRKGDLSKAKQQIMKVKHHSLYYYYVASYIYGQLGEIDKLEELFANVHKSEDYEHSYRTRLIFSLLKRMFIDGDNESNQFVNDLDELLDICIKGEQQETIEVVSELIIDYYAKKHQYKKAYEYCYKAYKYRRYGIK